MIDMQLTSAQAAKLMRRMKEEKDLLNAEEKSSKQFVVAIQEDVEAVRPAYDFHAMQQRFDALDTRMRKLKHAINVFNSTHIVDGFDMTIDEMLVYLPQLGTRKEMLTQMSKMLPRQRKDRDYNSSNNIEYVYANFDIGEARDELERVSELYAQAQTALDIVNNRDTLEVDI